jgi:curved DNA-binding protein CbpA
METLYDVLNVRADDDAESVRKAFRKAVKANHPDLNAGDPDAPSRFVKIVRANTILRDPELREIYDQTLELDGQRCRPQSKLVAIANTVHSIAANAIIGFVLAFVIAGGLRTYLSKTSDVIARESVAVAAVSPLAPVDATANRSELAARDKARGLSHHGAVGRLGRAALHPQRQRFCRSFFPDRHGRCNAAGTLVPDRWQGHRHRRQWGRMPCHAMRAMLSRPKSWWSCLLHPATR